MSNEQSATPETVENVVQNAAGQVKGAEVETVNIEKLPITDQPQNLKAAAAPQADDPNIIKIQKDQLQTLVNGNNNFMGLVFASLDTLDQILIETSNLNAKVLNMKDNLKKIIRGEPLPGQQQPASTNGQPIPEPISNNTGPKTVS